MWLARRSPSMHVAYEPMASSSSPTAQCASPDSPDAPDPAAVLPPATGPQARLQAALSQQFAAQRLCEQQYQEAGQAWHEAQRQVPKMPDLARQITEGLARALLDKLMVDREMCVRVISDAGGDRVSCHALNVTVISLLMARVFGFGEDDLLDLGLGALLHDVGKLDLPDRAFQADGPGSHADQLAYREHVALGLAHGRRMGLSDGALVVLAQHHEMADGSGFPKNAKAEQMLPAARLVACVNHYDNLCNPFDINKAMTPHEALSFMYAKRRDKFDAKVLQLMVRCLGVYPPGTLVQLSNESLAVVTAVNPKKPLRPRVLVYDPQVPKDEAIVLDLEVETEINIAKSIRPALLTPKAAAYLNPRKRVTYFFDAGSGPAAPGA